MLSDAKWLDGAWGDAVTAAIKETGLDAFPETCPWSVDQILDSGFLPE